MHKVSAKRQITLPKDLCQKASIELGDLVELFEYEGKITVLKQQHGVAAGCLKNLSSQACISDDESIAGYLESKQAISQSDKPPKAPPLKKQRRKSKTKKAA